MLPLDYTENSDAIMLFPELLESSGLRVEPKEGYIDSDPYGGILIEAVDRAGGNVLFMGAYGGRFSDDHLPYYEMIFKWNEDASNWVFVRGQQFFYDSAGIEGLEWYVAWFALSFLGIVLVFALLVLFWAGSWLSGGHRKFVAVDRPENHIRDDCV